MVVLVQKWLYLCKVVLFGKNGCNRVDFLYLGKRCCIWAKMVVFGTKWLYSGKVVVFGQSGCIWAKVV